MRGWHRVTAVVFSAAISVMAHSTPIYFSQAIYFDNNADGFIDSIVVEHSGGIEESDLSTLRWNIRLPAWRQININSIIIISASTIALIVEEQQDVPVTSVTSADQIYINQVKLTKGEVQADTIVPLDRVAPVLQSAQLTLYGNSDSLRVVFSERIRPFTHNRPFLFKTTSSGASYFVTISSVTLSDSILNSFPNNSSNMKENDSVWINTAASITDYAGNVQGNPENRRVLLSIEKFSRIIYFTSATYYDRNADGFIDNILISTKDTVKQFDLVNIEPLISLPVSRNFNISSIVLAQNGINLTVTENRDEPNTAVNIEDVINITQGVIPPRKLVAGASLRVQDSLAPVIVWAQLDAHDFGDDTIFVKFSESVNPVNSNQPFDFSRVGQGGYDVMLRGVNFNGDRYTGHVETVELDSIRVGDSIWIETTALVSDAARNTQRNPSNRRVTISVNLLDFPINLTDAAYFDANADGFIDIIKIWYNGPLHDNDLKRVGELIRLPSDRLFSIVTITKADSVITIMVKELGRAPRTSILPGDQIKISQGRLPEGGITLSGTISVRDSIDPVLINALLNWYSKEYQILQMTFSEPVKSIFARQPFLYITPDGTTYNVTMQSSNRIVNEIYTAQAIGNPNLQQNDSCWINNSAGVTDLKNNTQGTYYNRKVRLTVKYHFDMRYIAENSPFSKGKRPLPQQVVNAYASNNVQMPPDGMVIIVEPDRELSNECPLSGTISIYDVVQNPVIQKKKMIYDNNSNRMFFIWDGRNYNGREVGTGTYLAVIKVEGRDMKFTKKMNVGVKR